MINTKKDWKTRLRIKDNIAKALFCKHNLMGPLDKLAKV
jgi:hypothetical protein